MQRNQADQLESCRVLPQYAGMLLKEHQRDVGDKPLCDPTYVFERRDNLALCLFRTLFAKMKAAALHIKDQTSRYAHSIEFFVSASNFMEH